MVTAPTKQLKVNGLSMKQYIQEETRKRYTRFWGQKILLKPYLCDTIIGDGLQLCYVMSIDSRPQYWLIRIDSETNVYADDFEFEHLLSPIEEECGRWDEEDPNEKFPRFGWSGGFWGCVANFATGKEGRY